jgi:hypothetical protein
VVVAPVESLPVLHPVEGLLAPLGAAACNSRRRDGPRARQAP